jgi:hypothetical protein
MNTDEFEPRHDPIRVVQAARSDDELTLVASPQATPAEVKASTSSCVVHLCGCD